MIWHLLPLPDWQSAGDGPYVPGTEHAGSPGGAAFVHASPDEATTLAVANDRFTASALPLVALALDESRLSAPVRFEAADPAPPAGVAAGTLFPPLLRPGQTFRGHRRPVRPARSGRPVHRARPPPGHRRGARPGAAP